MTSPWLLLLLLLVKFFDRLLVVALSILIRISSVVNYNGTSIRRNSVRVFLGFDCLVLVCERENEIDDCVQSILQSGAIQMHSMFSRHRPSVFSWGTT